MLEPDLDAVGGVRIDQDAVLLMEGTDCREPVRVRRGAGDEAVFGKARELARLRHVEVSVFLEVAPELRHPPDIAPDEVEHVALEIRRLRDVHGGGRGRGDFRALAGAIDARLEEFFERVVLVGREDQAPDRKAHSLCDVSREDVAEVARRHGEIWLAVFASDADAGPEIVDDLRRDARPVDGIHRTELVALLECRIFVERLHDVLAIVERAADRDVKNVGIGESVHLPALEFAHPADRREHEHPDAFAAAQGVLGR